MSSARTRASMGTAPGQLSELFKTALPLGSQSRPIPRRFGSCSWFPLAQVGIERRELPRSTPSFPSRSSPHTSATGADSADPVAAAFGSTADDLPCSGKHGRRSKIAAVWLKELISILLAGVELLVCMTRAFLQSCTCFSISFKSWSLQYTWSQFDIREST